jgi:hypothetical protein
MPGGRKKIMLVNATSEKKRFRKVTGVFVGKVSMKLRISPSASHLFGQGSSMTSRLDSKTAWYHLDCIRRNLSSSEAGSKTVDGARSVRLAKESNERETGGATGPSTLAESSLKEKARTWAMLTALLHVKFMLVGREELCLPV